MSAPSLDLKGRIPELDGLRGIAIGLVLMHHYFFQAIDTRPATIFSYLQAAGRLAWSGVDLFFVLSGFLIGGILLDARKSSNYFRVFYTRRFFRIIPLYFAFLAIVFCLSALGRFGVTSDFLWMFQNRLPWLPHFFFLQNFWMAAYTSLGAIGLTVTWSLAIEEQFYLTLPPLVRFLSPRLLAYALAAGILLAPASRIALHAFAPSHHLAWFALMPCRADALLLGVLGAALLRDEWWKLWLEKNRRLLLFVLVPLAVGLAILTRRSPDPFGYDMLTVGYSWLALFYLCVLLCALLFRESWFGACLRWGWLTWLGSIAYGTYLFHDFIRQALRGLYYSGPPGGSTPIQIAISVLALVLTLGLCRLSWVFFEKPLIQIGHRTRYEFREREVPEATVSLSPEEGTA